tara:strand:+ start:149 stop:250 length:102 start_codon:yes stop_codon:yes gene_type:complete
MKNELDHVKFEKDLIMHQLEEVTEIAEELLNKK